MTSPFDRVPPAAATKVAPTLNTIMPVGSYQAPVPVKTSPFDNVAKQPVSTKMIYTVEDIDRVGADEDAKLSQLSDRVTKKMTLNRMGDIGTMLMSVQREVNNLDPANLVKTDGLMGKIRQHFIDIKVELTKRFQTADGAFSNLTAGMTKQIVQLTEWEKDDGAMYAENFERFKGIMRAIGEIEVMLQRMRAQAAAWPTLDATDPEAMMKAQEKFVLEGASRVASALQDQVRTERAGIARDEVGFRQVGFEAALERERYHSGNQARNREADSAHQHAGRAEGDQVVLRLRERHTHEGCGNDQGYGSSSESGIQRCHDHGEYDHFDAEVGERDGAGYSEHFGRSGKASNR
jgi:hypothetical protein